MHKQIKSRAGVSGFLLALLVTLSGGALAGIATTKHNLSTSGTGTIVSTTQTEICVFCHTPHDAIKNDNIPLWNHTLSSTATYGVYISPTFNGAPGELGGVTAATAGVSNLCLSCHDGSVAVNSMNNPSNTNPTTTFAGDAKIPGTSATNLGATSDALKNDHPVNFTYDAALATADGGLVAPGTLVGVKLFSNKVQCASCHDPHTSTQGAFLRVTQNGSQLCFACHSK